MRRYTCVLATEPVSLRCEVMTRTGADGRVPMALPVHLFKPLDENLPPQWASVVYRQARRVGLKKHAHQHPCL